MTDRARAPAADAAKAPAHATPREEVVLFLAAFSMVAGLIHVEAAVVHFGHIWWYGALFVLLAAFQVGWAVQLYRRPTNGLLALGAVISLGTIAIWIMTRTVGMPFGPEAWQPEGVGLLDLGATIDELAIIALALALVRESLDWLLTTSFRFAVYSTLTLTGVTLFLGGHSHTH